MYKQYAHLGGIADPLIVAWPKRIGARDEIRQRFVHVIDLYPTILEAAGVKRPELYRGRKLKPIEGASIVATFSDTNAATRASQYFELGGQRSYLDGNWRLATRHERGTPFEDDRWELYDVSKDPNELVDLAAQFPDKVKELLAKWNDDARKYGVFPLDDRNFVIKMAQERQRHGLRSSWDILPPIDDLSQHIAPFVFGFSHEITVDLVRPPGKGDGVLVAHGSKHGGYVLWIENGRLIYEQNQSAVGRIAAGERRAARRQAHRPLRADDDVAAVRGQRRALRERPQARRAHVRPRAARDLVRRVLGRLRPRQSGLAPLPRSEPLPGLDHPRADQRRHDSVHAPRDQALHRRARHQALMRGTSTLIDIPAGRYRLGSDDHYPEERPVRSVDIASFRIEPSPVTNRAFAEFVAGDRSRDRGRARRAAGLGGVRDERAARFDLA
jgi:hypothetical protein